METQENHEKYHKWLFWYQFEDSLTGHCLYLSNMYCFPVFPFPLLLPCIYYRSQCIDPVCASSKGKGEWNLSSGWIYSLVIQIETFILFYTNDTEYSTYRIFYPMPYSLPVVWQNCQFSSLTASQLSSGNLLTSTRSHNLERNAKEAIPNVH